MGSSLSFSITTESGEPFEGDTLKGTLEVRLKKPKKLKGFYVKYLCDEFIREREFEVGFHYKYHDRNRLRNLAEQVLVDFDCSKPLERGSHIFPFSVKIPSGLPPTLGLVIQQCQVRISHRLEAIAVGATSFDDQIVRTQLVVRPRINMDSFVHIKSAQALRKVAETKFGPCEIGIQLDK